MSRWTRLAVFALLVAAGIGAYYFPELRQRVRRLGRLERTEEQVRREAVQPPVATPTDVKAKAKIFWASAALPGTLQPEEIELPLSQDPVQRSKQLISALITEAPSPEQRALPADVTLLEFYLLADGTAVADFSDKLATATPSGILSEQMAVDSIARTLAANVEPVRRLKILIHGQDTDTLAGHVDLTGVFVVRAESPPLTPAAPASPPGKTPASGLTRSPAPGKLGP